MGGFAFFCMVVGVARVGGGAPIFSRAAAFTAEAVLNGLGLRGLEGMARRVLSEC